MIILSKKAKILASTGASESEKTEDVYTQMADLKNAIAMFQFTDLK